MSAAEVKPGYKVTEVGVIPEDWEVEKIGDMFEVAAAGDLDPSRTSPTQDINFAYPIYSNALTNDGLYGYASYCLYPPNSITITARGNLGNAVYRDHPYVAIGRVIVLKPATELDGRYFAEFINSHIGFAIESTGVPQLTAPQVSRYSIPLPPLPEQRAIAAALGDVDALLAALERLIAKRRAVKQAAMDALLSGRVRLPGFGQGAGYRQTELGEIPEDWEVRRLEEVAPLQRGFDLPSTQLQPGEFPVVYSNGILNYHNKAMVKSPGVVTGRSGTLGSVHFVEKDYWPHNTTLWVTDFKGNSPKFIFYLFIILKLDKFSGGSGVPTLNRNDVHQAKTPLPPLPEQRAIAEVLSDMDAALAALERQRAKVQALKQGMMAELLTGRVRLVK